MILRSVCAAALAVVLLACDDSNGEAATEAAAKPPVQSAAADSSQVRKKPDPKATSSRPRNERPLPAFSGWTLGGQKLSVSEVLGKRVLFFFFNPEVKQSADIAAAVMNVSPLRGAHNFDIVGIGTGSNRRAVAEFVDRQAIDFRVIDDSNAAIASKLGLRSPIALLGMDAEGYLAFGVGQAPEGPEAALVVENLLRESLRLPALGSAASPQLGSRPEAPTFSARTLGGDVPFDLAATRGAPVVLIFFLHTCPHCHDALASLRKTIEEIPKANRPVLVGLEITGKSAAVRSALAEHSLEFFPVVFDDDGSIRESYGVFGGVPDIFLIDAEGRIADRVQGWRDETDGPLVRMRLSQLAGAPVPMLLRAKGYSGNDACGVCHEDQHATWMFTAHAKAFDTLVAHGASNNGECIDCHVVGWGETGGFTSSPETPALENVGCESCHGRGGPHLSPSFVKNGNYEPVCATCHDPTHSLGFDYATFTPKISHAANAHLLSLPLEEKRALLAERGVKRAEFLPTTAATVGSDACKSCHSAEYATWSAGAHARAGQNLLASDRAMDDSCVQCHTTWVGREGGFPADGKIEEHADLGRVGCESCHGPGGDHVGVDAPRRGTIVSLGDKCDSCVILQICGGCHDDANDPGFEFEVMEKIEVQRHGTIEAGTGKPLGSSAGRFHGAGDAALAGHLMRLLDERG